MIDLRSDTVTQPTEAMRKAMAEARVGDDVFGDDPTVRELEETLADMAGKQAGLFLPSGTQSNLAGLLAHCARGDEYIVGQLAHTYRWEGGGAAVLGSIQPQPLEMDSQGRMSLDAIRQAIKPDDAHFARTRLLALENTWWGKVLPQDYVAEATGLARAHGLATHLDGARVFNAIVKMDATLAEVSEPFDSVSICLSKGLGAPVGSVLVGSRDLINAAHRWRKMAGGGMRQAGIIAAGGLHAVKHHVERLADDHANAERLAKGLVELGYEVESPDTNMVFVEIGEHADALQVFARERGVMLLGGSRLRLVTHLDVSEEDVDTVLSVFRDFREDML